MRTMIRTAGWDLSEPFFCQCELIKLDFIYQWNDVLEGLIDKLGLKDKPHVGSNSSLLVAGRWGFEVNVEF